MKKIIMVLVLSVMALGFEGHGLRCPGNAYGAEQPPIVVPNLNASGDAAYLYHLGFAGGIGSDIVSYKDGLVTLRGQALWAVDSAERGKNNMVVGAGLMLDMVKAVTKTQGQWKLGPFKPKVGPFIGYDFGNRRMDWGVVLQMLKVEF